jgi:spermidine synthase
LRRTNRYDYPPKAGKHVRLVVCGETMMSDTEMEKASNREFIRMAKGDVLIAGLGIGLIIWPIINKPEVTSVTVIEKYPDVITLVSKSVAHHKLTIIEEDIFNWKTKRMFDTIYFDIWPTISTDNLDEMATLNRKFARRLNPGGWRGSWMEDSLKYDRRRNR